MELGWVHARGGNLRRAEALFGQVLAGLDSPATGADGTDVVWIRRWTLEGLVKVLISAGRYGEAARLGEQTLRMAEDLGHPVPIVATMYRLASAYIGLGDLERAIALCVRSLGLSRERELSNTIQPAATFLGVAYTLAGRPADAIASLQEAVTVGESTNALDAFTVASLGHAYLESGRQEDASRCARTAFAMSDQARASVEAMALHLLGAIAARRDPPAIDEATQHYGRALALAGDLGMRPLVAHCHLGLGKLYRRTDKREQAQEHLTTATTMYREMGMTYWLEKAEAGDSRHWSSWAATGPHAPR
jgi:tetratricopeptide (TPR) repeat protein